MRLTIIARTHTHIRVRTSRCLRSSGLAENTKIAARHCRTNTTHNLCTPRRDATIMKESRCELINLAKPEKGTPESIRVGYTLSAYLSARFFLFSVFFFANETLRGNFLIYIMQHLFVFLEKFFFHNVKDTPVLKCRFEQCCVNITRSSRNGIFFFVSSFLVKF